MYCSAMHDNSEDVVVTTYHIYRKSDRVGVGASCEVYKGIHKDTHTVHALKVFKTFLSDSSTQLNREINALQKLKHKNVVGYYGQEKEVNSGRKIIVLELCRGGSLHSLLQEPEYVQGLTDKELLLVIEHMGAGLKFLKEAGFVHRDIKPGNVLRDVALDGTITYKLSDFGTSRQIKDGEQFLSLVGTEEYLHPDMYERAFVNRHTPPGYNESADAWSLGCTLFQTCTGDLPFKPFGGSRQNKETMFQMIKHKPPGTISGVQTIRDGTIQWRKTLPDTCNITKNLRKFIEPMLGDLLQCSSRMTTFLMNASKVLQLKYICVINADDATQTSLYTSPRSSYEELMDQLSAVLDVTVNLQLAFVKGHLLSELMMDHSFVDDVLESGDVVIAISMLELDGIALPVDSIDPYPGFREASSLKQDVKIALECCRTVSKICDLVSETVQIQLELINASSCLKSYLQSELEKLNTTLKRVSMQYEELASRLGMLLEFENHRKRCTNEQNTSVVHRIKAAKTLGAQLQMELFNETSSVSVWKKTVDQLCSLEGKIARRCTSVCIEKIKSLFTKIKGIWKTMMKRKETLPLSQYEEIIHEKDRKDAEEICARSVSLWQDHCRPNKRRIHKLYAQTKRHFLLGWIDVKDHTRKVIKNRQDVNKLSTLVMEIWAFSGRAWKDLSSQLTDLRRIVINKPKERSSDFEERVEITKRVINKPKERSSDFEERGENTKRVKELVDSFPNLETHADLPELLDSG